LEVDRYFEPEPVVVRVEVLVLVLFDTDGVLVVLRELVAVVVLFETEGAGGATGCLKVGFGW
jgi:hypothetical protein